MRSLPENLLRNGKRVEVVVAVGGDMQKRVLSEVLLVDAPALNH